MKERWPSSPAQAVGWDVRWSSVCCKMASTWLPSTATRNRWGRIINVTTSLGSMLRAGFGPYGASKAAAESLTRIMAEELKGTGVTVNVLTPGGLTNTSANPGAPFDRSKMIQPEVMGPPLRWLISDAASEVTGRRFLASHWNPSLPPVEAARDAGAPAAWDPGKSLPKEPERIA
ncbi:MAG: SDR family NAD(P)-dependent oxidoreductase [Betaproteobacteria bacterium]|nr:SDR family NAD(P)-dependent oxidoreductase [Betaproteobacteria bacterium]